VNKKKNSNLVFEAISHPIRIKIVELLAEKGEMGFSELKEELGISTGSIYHHLSMLSDFIVQNEKRKYVLNQDGKRLYRLIKENKFQVSNENKSKLTKIKNMFTGALFPVFLSSHSRITFFMGSLIAILNVLGLYNNELNYKLLFLIDVRITTLTDVLLNFIINWIIIYIILEITSLIFLKTKGNELSLFFMIPISLFPLLFFIYLWGFISSFNQNFTRFVFVLFQAWSFLQIIRAMQIMKNLSLQQALISALVLYFASVVAFLAF